MCIRDRRDNGYDISDYTAVNPVFGDMADFEEMVRVAKEHKIDFMLDMVLNHCSTAVSYTHLLAPLREKLDKLNKSLA